MQYTFIRAVRCRLEAKGNGMKVLTAGITLCLAAHITHAGEYHIFTDAQGRAIEARILSFDPVKGKAEIERKDGMRVWVEPSLFSGDDQQYVKEWIAAYRVLSEDCLRVSFDKRTMGSFKQGMKDDDSSVPMKGDIICYDITLRNRSKQPIRGLKVEYRYFINVIGSGQAADFLKKTRTEKRDINLIDPSERATFTTDEVRIEMHYDKITVWSDPNGGISGFEFRKTSEDDLLGIWVRISGPSVDGEPVIREVCYPENLKDKVSWEA